MEEVAHVEGLRMRYGDVDVLHGIDLRLARGQIVALLGPNGAGKTTAVEVLEGFRRRSAGRVEVLGLDPAHGDDAWRARIGVVLQSWQDHRMWRVEELVRETAALYAPYATAARARPRPVAEVLGLVGLADRARDRVRVLSGGQRRRLDLALALVGNPELLFLDEPTAGFDPEARRDFHDLVHRLTDLDDTAVLLTTHDMAEAEQLADRIVILVAGAIAAEGTPAELARQVGGGAEIRWRVDGTGYVHATDDAAAFVRQLQAQHGAALEDLEVRRPSLEETYLALVERARAAGTARRIQEVAA